MTLTQLLTDLYLRLGFASSPPTDVTTRLTSYLNETMREVLSEAGVGSRLLNDTTTFASVASQIEYGLPPRVSRIHQIVDRTNQIVLRKHDLDWVARAAPDPTQTGTPVAWAPLGYMAVSKQPSASCTLYVRSSSGSDTAQVARANVTLSGGYPQQAASATLTGTTEAALTPGAVVNVEDFSISATTVGNVTLYQGTGTTLPLATIPTGQTRSRYVGIQLWPTPAAATTYHVRYQRDVFSLLNGIDEPPWPVQFHSLLVHGARAKEYERRGEWEGFAAAKSEYTQAKRDFKYWLFTHPDEGGPSETGWSQLGPNYPADVWR